MESNKKAPPNITFSELVSMFLMARFIRTWKKELKIGSLLPFLDFFFNNISFKRSAKNDTTRYVLRIVKLIDYRYLEDKYLY